MASAQSAALRSVPGYVPAAPGPSNQPTNYPTLPTLPTVPALPGDATLPNYVGRQLVANQLGQLGTQQNNDFTIARAQAKQSLAGYGGWIWNQDDPTTAFREDLVPDFNPNAPAGQREKTAINQAAAASNATGSLYSSAANQNMAAAAQRMSLEGQAIVTQYAAQLNQIASNYNARGTDLVNQYAGYYGQDSAWAIEHPPPKPADWMAPAGTVGDVWAGYHDPDPAGLASMYPGMDFTYRTDPDGRVVATASPKPQAPAPAAKDPYAPNRAGNIVTGIKMSDLTPHSASLLAAQYPGYQLVRSGSGIAVLKKL